MASMDVESLYPSLKSEDTAEIIKETVVESELEMTDINVKELLIFIRKNMSNSEIENCIFKEYIPSSRKKAKRMQSNVEQE